MSLDPEKFYDAPQLAPWTYNCLFCGSVTLTEPRESRLKQTVFNVKCCERCSVPVDVKRGTSIRYGSPERRPAEAVYADGVLKRGEQYEVESVQRWQHGANVFLKGFDKRTFDLLLFTPADFERKED